MDVPERLTGRVFRGSDAVRDGLVSGRQLQAARYRRLFRDVYCDASIEVDHGVRCQAAQLRMPAGAALAGISAAWQYGVRLARPSDPVEVVVPKPGRFGPVAGIRISLAHLAASEIGSAFPGVTSPLRTAWDLTRYRSVEETVAYLDAMAGQGWFTVEELSAIAAARASTYGIRRATVAFGLVDGRSAGHAESRLRVRLVLAGAPSPVCQHVVHDAEGEPVGRVALAWPEQRVAVEHEVAWQPDIAQFRHDQRRLNRLLSAGWVVLLVTADRLDHDLAGVVAELSAALRRPQPSAWPAFSTAGGAFDS